MISWVRRLEFSFHPVGSTEWRSTGCTIAWSFVVGVVWKKGNFASTNRRGWFYHVSFLPWSWFLARVVVVVIIVNTLILIHLPILRCFCYCCCVVVAVIVVGVVLVIHTLILIHLHPLLRCCCCYCCCLERLLSPLLSQQLWSWCSLKEPLLWVVVGEPTDRWCRSCSWTRSWCRPWGGGWRGRRRGRCSWSCTSPPPWQLTIWKTPNKNASKTSPPPWQLRMVFKYLKL